MNKRICDFVSPRTEPDFFDRPDDNLQEIHAEIQKSIEAATAVMNIDLDPELIKRADAKLAKIGWTVEEACILFLYWCIKCPDKAEAWEKAHENRGDQSCSTSRETPTANSAGSSNSANG